MVLKKSVVWDYFKSSVLLKDFASCNICKREVPSGDLSFHLERHHPSEYDDVVKMKEESAKHNPVLVPSSEMAEVSSLLSLSLPTANVSFLVDSDKENEAVAIEVRPRQRPFRSYPAPAAPPAMWSAMIVWSSSGSVCVYVVKMDRQTVDSKEFRPDQTLEVVEFVKSHPFINGKWALCPGAKEQLIGEGNFLRKGGQPKCELVVPAEGEKECEVCVATQDRFAEKAGRIVKQEATTSFVDRDYSQGLVEVKLEVSANDYDADITDWGEDTFGMEDDHAYGDAGYFDPNYAAANPIRRGTKHKSHKRTSILWQYFTTKDNNTVMCNTCLAEIRTPVKHGSTSNLIRHLKNRHREMYDEFRNFKGIARLEPDLEAVANQRGDGSFSFGEGGERKGEVDPDYAEGTSSPQNSKSPKGMVKHRKTSVLWNYFSEKDGSTVICNTCNLEIRTARNHGSTSNLIRHLKKRHKEVYEDFRAGKEITKLEPDLDPESPPRNDVSISQEEGGEGRDEADPDFAPGNGSLNHSKNPTPFPKKKVSALWKYFTRRDAGTVVCNECKAEIKMPQSHGTTSNPIRHLKGKHMEMYQEFKSCQGTFRAEQEGDGMDISRSDIPSMPHDGTTGEVPKKSVIWEYYIKTGVETAICKTCNREMSTAGGSTSSFARHLLRQHRPVYEDYKAKRLAQLGLQDTMKSEFDSKADVFSCGICHKSFSTERKWAKHMQRHRGEPGVVIPDVPAITYKKRPKEDWCCDLCGAVTKYKARHMASVHKVFLNDKHPCEICGKVFGFKCELKKHLNTHTGEKTFVCSYCGKSFKSWMGRKYCEDRCSGNSDKFECSTCGKKFQVRQRLEAHERIHTGERPFVCPLPNCSSAYMTKTNMATHVKLTHKRLLRDVLAEMKQEREEIEGAHGENELLQAVAFVVKNDA